MDSLTIWKTGFSAVLALLISVGGYALSSAADRIERLESDRTRVLERLATIESDYRAIGADLKRIETSVMSLNQKMDLLLTAKK